MLLLTMLIFLCLLLVLLSKLGSIPRATATTPEPADDKTQLVRKLLSGIIGIGLFLGTVILKVIRFILDVWADSEPQKPLEQETTVMMSDGSTWHKGSFGWTSLDSDENSPYPSDL